MNAKANNVQSHFFRIARKAHARRHVVDTLSSLIGINVILAGLSFVTTLAIANLLGRGKFGDLAYAIAIGGYCVTIANCGMESTLIRDLVHFPERFDLYVSASILLRGFMLALALIGILGMNFLSSKNNQLSAAGVLIVFAEGIRSLYLAPIYDAWDKMKRHALYFFIERCIYFACIWVFVLLCGRDLSVGIVSIFMLISTAVGFTLQYHWALPRLNLQMDRKALILAANMLKRNLWIWSAILATLSFGGLSKIVLRHVSGSGELGGYAVAWQVVVLGSLLITQVSRIGNPRMARIVLQGIPKLHRIGFLWRYVACSTCAGAIIGLPAVFFPSTILRIFWPEYAFAAGSLRLLGLYVIVVGIGQVATQYLVAVHKEKIYSFVLILSGFLSLFLYYICIPQWSAAGAAFAVLVSHGVAIIIYFAIMTHHVLTLDCPHKTVPQQSRE